MCVFISFLSVLYLHYHQSLKLFNMHRHTIALRFHYLDGQWSWFCITGYNLAIKGGNGTSSVMEVLMGKSAANGGFPMAMFDYQGYNT
jgi:hypothetical protein